MLHSCNSALLLEFMRSDGCRVQFFRQIDFDIPKFSCINNDFYNDHRFNLP